MTDAKPEPRAPRTRVLILWNQPEDAPEPTVEAGISASRADVRVGEMRAMAACLRHGSVPYDVHLVNVEDDWERIRDAIIVIRPNLVINQLDQLFGDSTHQATVAGYLELLEVPYTGSEPLCLATCQERVRSHILLRDAGVVVPGFEVIRDVNVIPETAHLRSPLIVTQAYDDLYDEEGWQHPLGDREQLIARCAGFFAEFELPYLVEEYLGDRRLHAVVVGDRALEVLPLIEADDAGAWRLASLDHDTLDRVRDMARRAFHVMGCRDLAQIDLNLDEQGVPCVVDIRPLVDMGPESVLWAAAGFTDRGPVGVLSELVELARKRSLEHPAPQGDESPPTVTATTTTTATAHGGETDS